MAFENRLSFFKVKMLGEICKRSEIPSNLRDTKSSLVNSDICDGLDYLDSGLCVADLTEGTVG